MKLENQVCSFEQSVELHRLGVINSDPIFEWIYDSEIDDEPWLFVNKVHFLDEHPASVKGTDSYPAFTVAELLKALPFIIRHDHNDYFMSFGHSSKGYRVIYETNKLGLIFNLDDELDREKKALFQTMRSGKYAAQVLAEYLRMLLDSNSQVLSVDDVNTRLLNS